MWNSNYMYVQHISVTVGIIKVRWYRKIKKQCENCGNIFETWVEIEGTKRNLHNRKYCFDCSPFKSHNTKSLLKSGQNNYGNCKNCNKKLDNRNKVFCDQTCKLEYYYKIYIEKWKNHEVDGTRGNHGQLSQHVRKYIFEKYNYKCTKCGWSKINPYTNRIPLEVEHIDGNWKNSFEENLDLLCPNCHSLTKTYRGANRGHGRDITWIVKKK